jgi:hypothetical protein
VVVRRLLGYARRLSIQSEVGRKRTSDEAVIYIELLYWTRDWPLSRLTEVEWPAVPSIGHTVELVMGTYTVRYVKWVQTTSRLKVQVIVE